MTGIADDYARRLDVPSDMQGHLEYLRGIGAEYERIVELGVRSGNSTCAFLAGIYGTRNGHLWSVDIAAPDVPEQWHRSPRWSFLQADDMSPEALDWVPSRIDVLFIDTDPHSYDGVLAELHAYGPRVQPGGLILAHDTHPAQASDPGRAVSEYARLRGEAVELAFIEESHGLGILRVRQ